ncbi:putative lipoyltransferase 2, mitochondrial [Halotydeus destructor]|nr:putative lipoyltransferase 2, mitochondrial [Halotydeus destructor]
MRRVVKLVKLGRMKYNDAFSVQNQVFHRVLNSIEKKSTHENTLLLVEHEPVYTVGIRDKTYDHDTEDKLRSTGADFVRTNRGGLITFHGHGQLVAYPIIYLGDFNAQRSVKWFVHQVERTVTDCCSSFLSSLDPLSASKLTIGTIEQHPGVWINGDRKVSAIGVRASRYVTMHGFAINCNVDLNWFNNIVPCGIEGKAVTSLQHESIKFDTRESPDCSVEAVTPMLVRSFEKHFNCSIELEQTSST